MYFLSEGSSFSILLKNVTTAARIRSGFSVIAAALTSLMLLLPASVHAQTQTPATNPSQQVQVENTVDINTADAETLALALDGVGMAKARDIIAYREQNGAFETADDLQKVRGIGKATLERNRSRILVTAAED